MVADLARRTGEIQHQLRDFQDGQFTRIPKVDRIMDTRLLGSCGLGQQKFLVGPLINGFVRIRKQKREYSSYEVLDIAEAPRLISLAEYSKRLPLERLNDEVRHDPSVISPHTGAECVEDPHNPRIDPVIPMVGHRHSLRKPFRLVVDSARTDRINIPPIGLRLRIHEWITVNFGGAG